MKVCEATRHFLPPWIRVTSDGDAASPSTRARKKRRPLSDCTSAEKVMATVDTGSTALNVVVCRSVHTRACLRVCGVASALESARWVVSGAAETAMVRSPRRHVPSVDFHCSLTSWLPDATPDLAKVKDRVPPRLGSPASQKIASPTCEPSSSALTMRRPELAEASALKTTANVLGNDTPMVVAMPGISS